MIKTEGKKNETQQFSHQCCKRFQYFICGYGSILAFNSVKCHFNHLYGYVHVLIK